MMKRSQTFYPPSQPGYRKPVVVDGVVKSKAGTPWLYLVQTPQGEYRRNKLQLQNVAITTTVPVSTGTVITTTSTTVQPTSGAQFKKDLLVKPLCPIKELPNKNKGNFNVSAECIPDSSHANVVEKGEMKEPKRSSRSYKQTLCYIDTERNSWTHWYNKFIGYLRPSRTLNHVNTFIV